MSCQHFLQSFLGLNWLDLLIFGSYIKIGSSCIKYMPQVYLNWKRKCTLGFAIDKGLVQKQHRRNHFNINISLLGPPRSSSTVEPLPMIFCRIQTDFELKTAILDFSGGTACYLQTIIQYCNAQGLESLIHLASRRTLHPTFQILRSLQVTLGKLVLVSSLVFSILCC